MNRHFLKEDLQVAKIITCQGDTNQNNTEILFHITKTDIYPVLA